MELNFVGGLIFILGLYVGSFLNVLIERLPKNEKITGRSYCPQCKKTLAWYDLLPVVSYIFLRGKCRYCRQKISWQYPAVELATSGAFLLVFLNNYELVNLAFLLFVTSVLVVVFTTDLKYGIIPNKIIFPAIFVALIYNLALIIYNLFNLYRTLKADVLGKYLLPPYSDFFWQKALLWSKPLLYSLLGGAAISFFFLLLIFLTRGRGMGGGDVKFGFLMGLLTGWPNMVGALFLGFLTGAISSVTLILAKKKTFGQTVPFGPFLALGIFLMLVWGDKIVGWYLRLF